jgi:hypothetical protein
MEKSKSVDETPVLKDPFNDRQVKSVPLPYLGAPSDKLVWPDGFSKEPDYLFVKDF